MSILGSRVPSGLKVFLLALAIADDLGAVAVIAIFYTADLSLAYLGASFGMLGVVWLAQKAGVRAFSIYWVLGAVAWYFMVKSGVHATVAGVFLGFLTPTRPRDPRTESVLERGRHFFDDLLDGLRGEDSHGHRRHVAARRLQQVSLDALSPLDYLVHGLDRWVAFLIMPIFALSNAGVHLDASTLADPMTQRVGMAVALGLLIGKPIGITLFSWLAVRSGVAILPRGVNWGALAATGLLAGIGFTVALFITSLAFTDPGQIAGAKLGILSGSALATVLGLLVLQRSLPKSPHVDPEMSGSDSS
ncbi:MAG: Na+/H+ antiporter NhaA, partial [Deltaproteobacteria bacterium]|nr:Na+/H+ antiporter NhaA [Deltaproteobacteria bacterium]